MDPPSKKQARKRVPQIGKANRFSRTDDFLLRQSQFVAYDYSVLVLSVNSEDKTWLETHIWHAKRMKMENMWGYRLVRTDNISERTLSSCTLGCTTHGKGVQALAPRFTAWIHTSRLLLRRYNRTHRDRTHPKTGS